MDSLLPFFISYISILVLILLAGIVLNSMMLSVLIMHPEIRTPQSILLKSVCVSDLIYLLGSIILILMAATISHAFMCFITVTFSSFVMALNVYLVVSLSLQRYISQKKFRNTSVVDDKEYKYSLWIALGVWVLAIVLAMIESILLHPSVETWIEGLLIGVPFYRLVMYAMLPIALVTVLDTANSRLPAPEYDVPNEAMDRETDGRRMNFMLVLLCFLTYPPAIFISYVVAFHLNVKYRGMILPIGSILTTFNSFFHPIVMCIASKKLRMLFEDLCCCRRCCQQSYTSQQLSLEEREDHISVTVF